MLAAALVFPVLLQSVKIYLGCLVYAGPGGAA